MQIGNFHTLSFCTSIITTGGSLACCQQGKHRLLRRCYVPKTGIVHITRGTFPPGAQSGVEGLYYTILGNFNPAVCRMVFKCYGGLIIAALRSQSRCFSVLPDMPANTGAGSWLKDDRITIAGGASLCIVWHGAPASIWLRCSLLVICAGSKMCTVWVSPPVEPAVLKQVSIFPGAACPCAPLGARYRRTLSGLNSISAAQSLPKLPTR